MSDGTLRPLVGLLAQVRDLKRVRDARSPRSLAERQFGRAWGRLLRGEDADAVALAETAAAVAAVRLAGLDAGVMTAHGVPEEEAAYALERAFDDVTGPVEPGLRSLLRDALAAPADGAADEPPFVDALVRQPRAGATHPGAPRLVLEPAESHADHSFAVAAYGVLLAPLYEADAGRVFLVGLAHHLANAALPDAGHAADVLLGDDLTAAMARAASDRALNELPPGLRDVVRGALELATEAAFAEPEARAFHAADALDRVLEMAWHERTARFRLEDALGQDVAAGQLNICHGGFYQDFQRDVLRDAGLWTDGLADEDGPSGRAPRPSGSYERGGHGAVPAASPEAQGAGAEDGRQLADGATVARLERRELGS